MYEIKNYKLSVQLIYFAYCQCFIHEFSCKNLSLVLTSRTKYRGRIWKWVIIFKMGILIQKMTY